MSKTFALISLGCPKNLVDSENMTGYLLEAGYQPVDEPSQAQTIIVNTCGFIESAAQEAIDTILEMATYKDPQKGCCQHLVVAGCLAQRYHQHFATELPEVDAIVGTKSYGDIAKIVDTLSGEETHTAHQLLVSRSTRPDDAIAHLRTQHPISTGAYAYLKIAEGCDKRCAYCAIPGIRGDLKSRSINELVEEATFMAQQGVKEIILVGQDTTAYGKDLTGTPQLASLLKALSHIDGIESIRFLYAYADGITDELLETMATTPKILPYIDLPIQHASTDVLQRMHRTDTEDFLRQTFARIRKKIPHVTIRTTVMVGFPGETEEAFKTLCKFIEDIRFDHLGCFIFSPEEGTKAYQYPDRIQPEIAQARYDHIMRLQQPIALAHNKDQIGQCLRVRIEGISSDGIFYIGRTDRQAPDIDDTTHVVSQQPLTIGEAYPVKIVEAEPYGLTGVYDESAK